ncbi:MAG: response regulator [Candidatus Omnitrophota bacterium]|nr:response regulator [Candidatus Omnitrophota bacterium]
MPPPKVLIVEDERIVAKGLHARLTWMGYAVVASVASGEAAIREAEHSSPDLVLMDIRLEGPMDGIEAARRIQQRFNIPVVYLTAHADEQTFERAKQTRPCGYLTKPYAEAELKRAIESALQTSRQATDPDTGRTMDR